jgi:hypothetical protein
MPEKSKEKSSTNGAARSRAKNWNGAVSARMQRAECSIILGAFLM